MSNIEYFDNKMTERVAMKVALLGATGFVGSALLKEALDRGHVVTAIVRHPEKLEKREGLTAKAGDVYDTASLATLIRGNEALSAPSILDGRTRSFMTTRFEEQHPSSPRSRRRESKGCSGWAERVGWRSNLESVLSTARICRSGKARFFGDDQCSGPTAKRA